MDKYSKVSPKIAQTFEIIGSYFCDIYYNHLYLSAKSKKKNNDASNSNKSHSLQSITDEYKQAVVAFGYAIKKDKNHYSKSVTGMYRFYQTYSKFSTMTLNQFIDMLLEIFVPPDYYNQMDSRNRDQLLVKIVIALIDNMCIFVTRPDILQLIIDKHGNTANIAMLQDHAIETLINERDKIFSMFVSANVSPEQEIVSKLKASIKDILQSKVKLESENKSLKQRVTLLESKIKELAKELITARQTKPPAATSIVTVQHENDDWNTESIPRKPMRESFKMQQRQPNNSMDFAQASGLSLNRNNKISDDRAKKSIVKPAVIDDKLDKDTRAKELGITFTNSDEENENPAESNTDSDENTDDDSGNQTSGNESDTSSIGSINNDNEIIDEAEMMLKKKQLQKVSKLRK